MTAFVITITSLFFVGSVVLCLALAQGSEDNRFSNAVSLLIMGPLWIWGLFLLTVHFHHG